MQNKDLEFRDAIGFIPDILEAIESNDSAGFAFSGGMISWLASEVDENGSDPGRVLFRVLSFDPFEDKETNFECENAKDAIMTELIRAIYAHAKGLGLA